MSNIPYGYCPACNGNGVSRERRPNGNDRCVNGHTYPSRDALPAQAGSVAPQEPGAAALKPEDQSYHGRMDGPMEVLANTLNTHGCVVEGVGLTDSEIVEIAARKLDMLVEMVRAAGLSEGLLKAAMRG